MSNFSGFEEKFPVCYRILICIKNYWFRYFVIYWPLLCLLVFIYGFSVQQRCLYVMCVMFGYWSTECIPEFIISFIPLFALPLLHVQDTGTTCRIYFEFGFFATSALCNAVVVSHSGLPQRFLFSMLHRIGGSPRKILFALTLITAGLSTWMANAFIVQVILPLVLKIFARMDMSGLDGMHKSRMTMIKLGDDDTKQGRPTSLIMAFYFGVVYASSAGGINYMGGTGCNLIFKGLYVLRYPICGLASGRWFLANIIQSTIISVLICIWLEVKYLGLFNVKKDENPSEYDQIETLFKDQRIAEKFYEDLDPMSWHECLVASTYSIAFFFWVYIKLIPNRGWEDYIIGNYFDGSMPSFIVLYIMMLLPSKNIFAYTCSPDPENRPKYASPGLISWKILQKRVPWERIFVIGASCSLGYAQFSSGFAKTAGNQFIFLKGLPYHAILGILTFVAFFISETAHNSAICGFFSPIIIEMSIALDIHPILLGIPFVLVCPFGMLFPCSSVNVKAAARIMDLNYRDLIISGTVPKLIAAITIFIIYPFWGTMFFNEVITKPFDFKNITGCYCQPCINQTFSRLHPI